MRQLTLPFFFACLLASAAHAQTRTSVANGDWFDPNTWNPVGVPAFTDQFIYVNTQVTFSQNIVLGGSAELVKINPGASLINTGGPDSLVYGCEVFRIEGYLETGWLQGAADDSVVNTGSISVTQDQEQSGTFINRGSICVGLQLVTSDDLENDGSIRTSDWISGATVSGSGQFCISGMFINSGSIGGTVDVCDASPGWTDYPGQMGSGVTSCAAGPCATCQPSGIKENAPALLALISPNPFSSELSIALTEVSANENFIAELFDLSGRLVRREMFTGSGWKMRRADLQSGMYLLRVRSEDGKQFATKVSAE